MAILIDGRLALAEEVNLCQPFWPSNGVEDEVCPFLLRQLFEADQVLCIQVGLEGLEGLVCLAPVPSQLLPTLHIVGVALLVYSAAL